jgi:hypothetical protein
MEVYSVEYYRKNADLFVEFAWWLWGWLPGIKHWNS